MSTLLWIIGIFVLLKVLTSVIQQSKTKANVEAARKYLEQAAANGAFPQVQTSLLLKEGEVAYYDAPATLYESRAVRTYQSVRVSSKVVFLRGLWIGATKGRSVSTQELALIDKGVLTVTNNRLVFQGQQDVRNTTLANIINTKLYFDALEISVENKQKAWTFSASNPELLMEIVTTAARPEKIEPTAQAERTVKYPVKLIGQITWSYPDRSPETFPVPRAIIPDKNHVTLDCDCGTQSEPYIYTIETQASSGDDFVGTFSAGKARNQRSSGQVSGTYQSGANSIRLVGVWIEEGKESNWVAELHPVRTFPDEVSST